MQLWSVMCHRVDRSGALTITSCFVSTTVLSDLLRCLAVSLFSAMADLLCSLALAQQSSY